MNTGNKFVKSGNGAAAVVSRPKCGCLLDFGGLEKKEHEALILKRTGLI